MTTTDALRDLCEKLTEALKQEREEIKELRERLNTALVFIRIKYGNLDHDVNKFVDETRALLKVSPEGQEDK